MDYKDVLLSFDGRISRYDYWLKGILPIFVVLLIISVIDSYVSGGIINLLASILSIYPTVAVVVKRFHDRNKSGWWALLLLIPVIGPLWILIECGILKGTESDNDYGPDPLAAS